MPIRSPGQQGGEPPGARSGLEEKKDRMRRLQQGTCQRHERGLLSPKYPLQDSPLIIVNWHVQRLRRKWSHAPLTKPRTYSRSSSRKGEIHAAMTAA